MQQVRIIERTVTDFFQNEYLDYARYTVENRAIPSYIDGLKPTQRKIIYIADKVWRNNDKPLKVFQLTGRVAAEAQYHHGDASANNAIILLAQDFKNSMPLLQGKGQFGSLRNPVAGAPRYISVVLHPNFRDLYKDFELLDPRYDEGEQIEPAYFLPIIPTVLLNGSSGIAVGFASDILNRNPLDLIEACLSSLKGKSFDRIRPWYKDFKGSVSFVEGNQWEFKGTYEVKNTTTVEVTELPPSMTYEKYETHLSNLIAKKIVSSYDNHSSNGIKYIIKFQRQILQNLITKGNLESTLKLIERASENFTTLDEFGKLRIFSNEIEIVNAFTKFRLNWYDKRLVNEISKAERKILIASERARFIKMIIENKIDPRGIKKQDLDKILQQNKFEKVDENYDYLTGMPINTLTKEKYEELLKQLEEYQKHLRKLKETRSIDLYQEELVSLKNKIKK